MTNKTSPGISKAVIGCLVLAGVFLIVLLGGGAVLLRTQLPPVADQAPTSLVPLVVTITNPAEGTELALNEPLRITAEALGAQPITALELWVDGTLAEVQAAPPNSDQKQLGAAWSWTVKTNGVHTLLVRAKDAANHVGDSNIVRVTAAKQPSDPQVGIYKAQPGDTVKGIASKVKADPQQIVDLNPTLGLDTALPTGSPVIVPVPPGGSADPSPALITSAVPPVPPSDSSGKPTPDSSGITPVPTPTVPSGPVKPVDSPPDKTTFWVNRNVLARILPIALATVPKAPTLAGETSGCSVRLFVSDQSSNEDGFFIYRLGPADAEFTRIATIAANDESLPLVYTDSVSMGNYEYYVAAFNAQGEAPSNFVSVDVSLVTCLLPGDTGLWFDDLKLTPSQPTDKGYCYISTDDGPWTRVPAGDDTFLTPKGGAFDLSEYVGDLAPKSEGRVLNFECWGWQGGKLNYLGKGAGKLDAEAKTPFKLDADLFRVSGAASLRGPVSIKPITLQAPVSNIASPTGLARTLNPSTCADHFPPGLGVLFGAMLCKEGIEKGDLVLVWNWKPNACGVKPCITDIQGYHIYNVTGKTRILVRTVTPKDMTGQLLPAVKITSPPTCFVVTAYKGKDDSFDSNKLCITSSASAVKKMTLKPTLLQSIGQSSHITSSKIYCTSTLLKLLLFVPLAAVRSFDTSGLGGTGWSVANESSSVAVGYDYHKNVGTEPLPCPERTSQFYRGLIYFDLTKIGLTDKTPLDNVWLNYHDAPGAATFRVDEADDDLAGGVDATGLESCVGDIYIADVLRDSSSDSVYDGERFGELAFLATQRGESRSTFDLPKMVDARSAVRQWLTNKKPGVFMFVGFSEELDPPDSDACLGRYDRFSLDIEYFPGP